MKHFTNSKFRAYQARKLAERQGISVSEAQSILKAEEESAVARRAQTERINAKLKHIEKSKKNSARRQQIERYNANKKPARMVSGGAPGLGRKN